MHVDVCGKCVYAGQFCAYHMDSALGKCYSTVADTHTTLSILKVS